MFTIVNISFFLKENILSKLSLDENLC
jgi:hypothetical protein